MSEHIHAFLSEWTTAKLVGDAETPATLLTDDFYGVGPLGFVLPRRAWLDHYRQGLAHEQFSLEEIQVRLYGNVVVVVGARNNARGTYQGHPLPEGTRGSPPMPGPTDAAESSADTNADRKGR
jgi:ketosteroid isomerase-like protein